MCVCVLRERVTSEAVNVYSYRTPGSTSQTYHVDL